MHLLVLRLLPKNKIAVYAQIVLVMIMFWLRDVLNFPSAITYLTDVLLIYILFSNLYGKRSFKIWKDTIPQYTIVTIIVLCMFFGALINFVEPLLVLWGLRNNLRFFLFFFVCIKVLDTNDVYAIISIFKRFFWLNVVMCTFQYFVLGLKADYLGGFFGTARGCNAYLNVFICMIFAITLAEFYVGKIKAHTLALYSAFSLYMAFAAELKVFYVELVVILIITIIVLKPSVKTVIICFVFLTTLVAGSWLLLTYDIDSFNVLFDASVLEVYLGGNGYTNSGDLNRFTAIQEIYSRFFEGNTFLSLVGFGLGGCEYSQFSFLQSEFSLIYDHLNYRWFTHAWVYLEQGVVGLALLVIFFISLFVYAVKRTQSTQKHFMIMALAFLPTCILGMIYNTAIQIEACYLIAFMCAIPYIVNKSKDTKQIKQSESV